MTAGIVIFVVIVVVAIITRAGWRPSRGGGSFSFRRVLGGLTLSMIALCVIVLCADSLWQSARETWWPTAKPATVIYIPAPPQVAMQENQMPRVRFETTPATLTLDYAYALETHGKTILVQYPGEAPFKYNGECTKSPQPRWPGPKVFTDPDDPDGHLPFTVYPIVGEMPNCPAK